MIRRKSLKKKTFYIFTIIIIFGLFHQVSAETFTYKSIDPNDIPDDLAKMSKASKANYDKISTWQGKMIFEKVNFYRGEYAAKVIKAISDKPAYEPNELIKTANNICEFRLDVKNNRLFTYYTSLNPVEYIDTTKQTSYSQLSSDNWRIKTDTYDIECYPDRLKKDNTIIHKKAIKNTPRKQPIIWGSDPRGFFQVSGSPVWVLLSQLAESFHLYEKGKVNSVYNVALEKSEDGKIYRVKVADPGKNQWLTIFTLDGSKGFNPISIEEKYPNGATGFQITTEFTQIGEAFLPIKSQIIRYGPDGSLTENSQVTLSNIQTNLTLSENTFSLNNLGLKNGDSFIDKIANKEYKYKDANLVFVEDLNNQPK